MLAGEYAVARAGAPAVACAVTARLHVAFETGGAEAVVSSARAELEGAPLAAVPVLGALVDRLAPQGLGGQFTITSELGFGSAKPGLGSSAALVVAAAGALCASEGWTPLSLTELIDVHRAGQGGGSGYDVATALYGGVCRFQHRSDGHDVRTLAWPDGLHYRVVHLGSGVSTGAQLAKLDAGLEGSGAAVGAALDAQCAASVAVADALDQGTSGLSELAHHETTLRALDRAAGLGVATPAYLA